MSFDDDNKIRRRKVSSSSNIHKEINSVSDIDRRRKSELKNNAYKEQYINDDGPRVSKNSRSKSKKKKKKKYNMKILKGLLATILVGLVLIATIGSVFILATVKDTTIVNSEVLKENYISSEVASGEEIPRYLKEAVVSIEDERFYKHKGVDIISLARAFVHNLTTDTTQGGSTIEMQISKNLLTTNDQTMKRKIKDIYNAIQMNKTMTKDEILVTYLNNIYLGKSAYGVKKGARVYFGKDVSDLTLAESAMLVGITNNPAKYKEHTQAKKRQETILYKMKELGYITEEEYTRAIRENVPFKSEIE